MLLHIFGNRDSLRGCNTGAAWLSSVRAVRCSVKSENERNPHSALYVSQETALHKVQNSDLYFLDCDFCAGRKEGMTSNQHGPLMPWATHVLQWEGTMGCQTIRWSQSQQNFPQFRLRAETRPHEVGIASNRGSASPR